MMTEKLKAKVNNQYYCEYVHSDCYFNLDCESCPLLEE